MKKISRKDLQALRRQFPVLTEFEMRGCVGGNNANTSWDCLFNCMHYMDPSRSTQDYYNEFVDRYNYDPKSTGGVFSNNEGDALETFGFKNVSTNSMKNSKDYHYVIILDNNDGTSHAVIALSIPGEDGTFSYNDPTRGGQYRGNKSDIISIYQIKKTDITNPHDKSSSGYSGYYDFDYNDYEYNGYHNSNYEYNNYGNDIDYSNDNGYESYNNQFDYGYNNGYGTGNGYNIENGYDHQNYYY